MLMTMAMVEMTMTMTITTTLTPTIADARSMVGPQHRSLGVQHRGRPTVSTGPLGHSTDHDDDGDSVGPTAPSSRGTAPRPPYSTDNDDDGDDHADGDDYHDDDSDDDDNDGDDTDLFCANSHGDEVPPPCKPPSTASEKGRDAAKPLLTALYTRCCALYSH